ncbi:HAD family hydrolase [Paenibacillus spiritus]|uniref:HAD family hydrolase n=1 Tax=Paenibacillus spiritus TaxID=2496557 RepID=A0A5J5GKE6_9BACL|nr:HAD family hydrolase [Paenibacillus spiritus]KAA9008497.1 HAD family hydrolase [Paenibacillus spiritus]
MGEKKRTAVFWDLDDTLYDQMIPFRKAMEEAGGLRAEEQEWIHRFRRFRYFSDLLWPDYLSGRLELTRTRELRWERMLEEAGLPGGPGLAALLQQAYIDRQYDIEPNSGTMELLERLVEEGRTVGIITNGPETHQMKKIRALGLDRLLPERRFFISDAVGLAKPDPKLFRHVNAATGTEAADSVYIGDSWENDVAGALAAGWNVCWYNPRGRRPEPGPGPTLAFADFGELVPLLLGSSGSDE